MASGSHEIRRIPHGLWDKAALRQDRLMSGRFMYRLDQFTLSWSVLELRRWCLLERWVWGLGLKLSDWQRGSRRVCFGFHLVILSLVMLSGTRWQDCPLGLCWKEVEFKVEQRLEGSSRWQNKKAVSQYSYWGPPLRSLSNFRYVREGQTYMASK